MKKKEVLIIFGLAVLVTGGSWFRRVTIATCRLQGFPKPYFSICLHGTLFPPSDWTEAKIIWQGLFLDLLFWFLVLAVGWWVVKWIKGKVWKK